MKDTYSKLKNSRNADDVCCALGTVEELCFSLQDSGNIVHLEPIERINYESSIDYDKNWIKTKITLKGGVFFGQYVADIMTIDFERFKQELYVLYDKLDGKATFADLENALKVEIQGNGIGHFEVKVTAHDKPSFGANLNFTMCFDQTCIKLLVHQLDEITKRFPIIGDFNIKNESI